MHCLARSYVKTQSDCGHQVEVRDGTRFIY